MPLFRCYNRRCRDKSHGPLGHDFTSELPVCDLCGTDGRQRPALVIRLKIVHFDPPHPTIDGEGVGRAACKPDQPFRDKQMFSKAPFAVNCPACRETEAWKQMYQEQTVDEEGDFPVEVDPKRGIRAG